MRGAVGAWSGGQNGAYWMGAVRVGGALVSAIRQGGSQLTSEPLTAVTSVRYRLEKRGTNTLRLLASCDGAPFHQVGSDVSIMVNPGAWDAVEMTHVGVLDTSGATIDVSADDFVWRW